MAKISTRIANFAKRESEDMFIKRISEAYIYKPVIVNDEEIIYCLADNNGRILHTDEVNELFINIRTFYKDIPDVDEAIKELNHKLFMGESD